MLSILLSSHSSFFYITIVFIYFSIMVTISSPDINFFSQYQKSELSNEQVFSYFLCRFYYNTCLQEISQSLAIVKQAISSVILRNIRERLFL